MAIAWQFPHLLQNRNYSKTRPLKLNSFHIIFSLYRPDSFYSLPSFFSFFWHKLLNYRLQFINMIWKRQQINQGRRRKKQKGVQQLQIRQLWHSSLENWSSFSVTPASSCFSSGRLRYQSSSKIWVISRSAFTGADRRTRNFKLTTNLDWTVRNFPFPFSWRTRDDDCD